MISIFIQIESKQKSESHCILFPPEMLSKPGVNDVNYVASCHVALFTFALSFRWPERKKEKKIAKFSNFVFYYNGVIYC